MNKKLNILHIAPPYLPLNPNMGYGGIERNILYLSDQFSKLGHKVFLAGPQSSKGNFNLIPAIEEGLWENGKTSEVDPQKITVYYNNITNFLLENLSEIDIIHDHPGHSILTNDFFLRNLDAFSKIPILTTLHGSTNKQKIEQLIDGSKIKGINSWYNAISHDQKYFFSSLGMNIDDVIYHGIPVDNFNFSNSHSNYLFSLGRISRNKGQDIAIKVAKTAGKKLIIAGSIAESDREFYETQVRPLINGDDIQYIGELNDLEKIPYYQNAQAFLMPIRWDEPFGLVMPEAMLCGTPVIGIGRGSVSEVVGNKGGYVISQIDDETQMISEMVARVNNLPHLDRKLVRDYAYRNFTLETEAEAYIRLYKKMIK